LLRLTAVIVLTFTAAALVPMTATAEPPSPPGYLEAVERAYALIAHASPSDRGPADQAYRVLSEGTGDSQPEILEDLGARPPEYADARARLAALATALRDPMTTADPDLALQRLRDVLASSRYDALRRQPSPLDRLSQWVQDRLSDLLRLLFGSRGGAQPALWWLSLIAVVIVIAVVLVVFRAARGRFARSLAVAAQGPRPAADYFAEADRLAARGDRVGAIRALCAGVAASLAGERTWEGSPLTVREIFQRSPDFGGLRPLLAPFEAAVYGGRAVDAKAFQEALRAAAPFRRSPTQEVAA
jgi:hypothetical protein